MEKNKTKGWRKMIYSVRRLYHSLNNYRSKAKNLDFRDFSFLEYAKVQPEDIKDLKRLNYIKQLDLAKNGYINSDLKKLLTYFREKERLMRKDHTILPIGNFKVLENDNILGLVQLGFDQIDKTFFMASRNHENIPLWKPFDDSRFGKYLSNIHPVSQNALQFQHSFFEMDISQCSQESKATINKFYNSTVQFSFQSNPYFKAAILSPREEVLSDAKKFVGKTFRLALSKNESHLMTLTEATDHYFVFQSFLKSAPEPESLYFNKKEFKERFLDSGITLIARLKHNLQLGVQNGILQIGKLDQLNGTEHLQWESFENRIDSNSLSAIEKYYLSNEVISKKNFLVEKDAIVLQSKTKEAQLKKHYGTGKWHFAESQEHTKELHFRPVDENVLKHIQDNYGESKNFNTVVARMKINTNEQTMKIQ